MSSTVITDASGCSRSSMTAKDFLLLFPNCPYTAALVTSQDQVQDWAAHWQRLLRSVLLCCS